MSGDFATVHPVGSGASVERVAPIRENQASANLLQHVSTSKQMKQLELTGESFSIGEEQMIRVIERANKALQGATTSFEFSIHEKTKQIMVKVLDRDSGEVIREIPPEKTLDMVARMWEMAGILVDERR
ncbi:flagellar protein FlaG [Paenibacillus sp. GYB003]|uniref:flagellar protein FlaG n=1 Tax=Paenibacillus sp. GYB003 TaxID=2994392 RepID=UPI002F967888